MADLIVSNIDGQLLVDSRLIAERLGIQHDTLFATIEKYSDRLSSRNQVRFQIEFRERPQGGKSKARYALLDERQATLLMTMSRNTEQVLDCKEALVDAFEKAKAIIATVIPAQSDRIRELELELQLRRAEQKLIDTRQLIVTTCPEVVQQKILGYQLVEKTEYIDRCLLNDQFVRDGNTATKTELCQRYSFLTRNGKPDYTALNRFLVASKLPSDAIALTAQIREGEELRRAYLPMLDEAYHRYEQRSLWMGES